jgi:hypothetical protein
MGADGRRSSAAGRQNDREQSGVRAWRAQCGRAWIERHGKEDGRGQAQWGRDMRGPLDGRLAEAEARFRATSPGRTGVRVEGAVADGLRPCQLPLARACRCILLVNELPHPIRPSRCQPTCLIDAYIVHIKFLLVVNSNVSLVSVILA